MAHLFLNRVHKDLLKISRSLILVGYQSEARIWDFLLVLNSNLSAILRHFRDIRDIRAFVRQKPLFRTPPLLGYSGQNFSVFLLE